MNRRKFLARLAAWSAAGLSLLGFGGYAEPALALRIQRWTVRPKAWTAAPVRIAVIADLHVGEPWVGLTRIAKIVEWTNALGADLIVFAGDLEAGHRFVMRKVPLDAAAAALGRLRAPLGVIAVQGNHDWWHDPVAQAAGHGPTKVETLLRAAGIPVLDNRAVRVGKGQGAFWVAGLADQLAIGIGPGTFRGLDDLPGTLAQVDDDRPVVLLAHEPDIFVKVPDRVALTISGHTHGGQVRLFGWSPVVPSAYGNRFAYGRVIEGGRHMVVSGGIGCSIVPFRLGMPPEITVIDVEAG
jgi:predicted MPP superfamily phosphohydrolase